MNRDVERLLAEALHTAAAAAVRDDRPPIFEPGRDRLTRRARRRHAWLAPLLAAAAVVAVVATSLTVASRLSGHKAHPGALLPTKPPEATPATHPATHAPQSSAATSARPGPTKAVHVSLFQGDGMTFGVGMPLIAQFSKKVTDAHPFDRAVTVRVNGKPANGAWFWVNSNSGYAMEAHYRMQDYWPAHSKIEMNMPLQGVSAGPGLAFDDSLTLQLNIGASHISTVSGAKEQMFVTADGKPIKTMPVSLGKAATPTYLGTKLVMEKKNPQLMESAPGDANPYKLKVPWSVRLTLSGEFAHAAAWNTGNIGSRSTSHGCTNLKVADAEWFYNFSQIGDVVTYLNTGTSKTVPSWDGYADWNVSWVDWQAGNLLKNH
jgi:lipoprotein-anchoring transpeptidase ErfK/SrfK